MMILPTGINHNDKMKSHGFTLIELILVMAILSTIVVAAAPSLSRFIHGQSLMDEARRMVALTRYASNQSISSGTPLLLWIDENEKTFGLRAQNGYEARWDENYLYTFDENIELETLPRVTRKDGLIPLYFFPDGRVELEKLQLIHLMRKDDSVYIAKETIGTDFRILNEKEYNNEVWVQ